MKRTVVLAVVLLLCLYSNAQSTGLYGKVQMGQICPDIEIKSISNFSSPTFKLSGIRKKLIIMDFWSTYCKACIVSFPKIEALQKEFNETIQIILVTEQRKGEIDSFFSMRKKIKRPDLPFITDDTILKQLFPYYGLPQHVWLDENRKVVAITAGYNATREHIEAFINGRSIKLSEKKVTKKANDNYPLFTGSDSSFLKYVKYYSYLLNGNDSIKVSLKRQQVNGSSKPNRILVNQTSISELFTVAFNENEKFQFNRKFIELDVKDKSIYDIPADKSLYDEWRKNNLYLYDLLVPAEKADQLYSIMQQDLSKYFGIEARIEKRKMKCWVLMQAGSDSKLESKGGATRIISRKEPYADQLYFQNVSVDVFADRLNYFFNLYGFRFANNISFAGNIDIMVNASIAVELNIEELRRDLNRYDLDLEFKEWEIDVLVLRERKGK